MAWLKIPQNGQLSGAESPTGSPIAGIPGYFVSDALATAGGLADLELSFYGQGGPDVNSQAYGVSSNAVTPLCSFDTNRLAIEIYCDDSSAGAVYLGGPQVQAITGGNQASGGVRLNPGQGRIYDGAQRTVALYAICAGGQTATVAVMLTPRAT